MRPSKREEGQISKPLTPKPKPLRRGLVIGVCIKNKSAGPAGLAESDDRLRPVLVRILRFGA